MRFSGFLDLLDHFASRTPDAPALLYAAGGTQGSCTYSELFRRVKARAETLRQEGKGTSGILADGSFDCVVEIFASVLAGRRTVMLNENAADEVLLSQIREAELDALWGDEELCEDLKSALVETAEGGPGKILFFTSGTTERAKAVVLSDRTLMNSAYNGGALLPLQPSDILLCMLPLDHVFGFVCGLLWGLSCGAAVALGRGQRHYMDDCAFFRPTALSAVPMLLGFLLQHQALNEELKLILVGAGGCPKPLRSPLWIRAHGDQLRRGIEPGQRSVRHDGLSRRYHRDRFRRGGAHLRPHLPHGGILAAAGGYGRGHPKRCFAYRGPGAAGLGRAADPYGPKEGDAGAHGRHQAVPAGI